MRRWGLSARDAIVGGRFVTVWSLAASALLSLTVMAAPATDVTPGSLFAALVVSWACFAAVLTLLGALERTVRRPRIRAVAVVAGVVLAAATRPSLQDAWLIAVGAQPPPDGQLPSRILTNVVVWSLVLTAIAVVVDAWRSLRDTNALLRVVVAELDAARERAADYAARSRRAVHDAAIRLRGAVAQLDADAGGVSRLAAAVRAASHRLAALADEEEASALPSRSTAGRGARPVFRVPPRGMVVVLYVVFLTPYAVHAASLAQLSVAVAIVVAGGYAADRIARSAALRRCGIPAPALFLACSGAVGAALSASAAGEGIGWPLALVPAVVYTASAAGLSVCAGAIHALRVEQRRLSGAVIAQQRAAHAATAADRSAVRAAAELLHRDGQGACTVFAIAHPRPAAADVSAFAREVADLIDRMTRVFVATPPVPDLASFDGLLDTWARVIDLRVRIGPDAREALDLDPLAAGDVYEILAEGLLNAVKHGRTRAADVLLQLVATGAGPRLRVVVRTSGPAAADAELRPASRVRALGARLHVDAEGVRLEASIALDGARIPGAVVSAEHVGGNDGAAAVASARGGDPCRDANGDAVWRR